jgi:hypothetical protein
MAVIDRERGVLVSTGHVGTGPDGEPVTSFGRGSGRCPVREPQADAGRSRPGFEHVARMTSYIKSYDPEFMATFRAVRLRYFNADCPPASVMVQAGLYDDRLLVEVRSHRHRAVTKGSQR